MSGLGPWQPPPPREYCGFRVSYTASSSLEIMIASPVRTLLSWATMAVVSLKGIKFLIFSYKNRSIRMVIILEDGHHNSSICFPNRQTIM